jgi:hypothetical protein
LPTLKALKRFPYGRKVLEPGEPFEATDKDARLLKMMGKAKDPDPAPKMVDLPKRKTEEAPAEPEAPLSGHYRRRDMTATDGQTGEAKQPSSSRRGRRPKEQDSTSQEDDAEQ